VTSRIEHIEEIAAFAVYGTSALLLWWLQRVGSSVEVTEVLPLLRLSHLA
jgi:hypothetical protein